MNIPARKWKKDVLPRRILAIRLQAMGDLVITLPYLQHLRNTLPAGTRLDLLTREEVNAIPREIELFDKVYTIRGGRNTKKQLIYTALLLPELWARRYEIVIDLQNNIISRLVRKILLPRAWSEFDRFSPVPAGESTRLTIEAVGLGKCDISSRFKIRQKDAGRDLLIAHRWDGNKELIVLNPAGAFPTRNWAMDKYVEFARLWLQRRPASQFLVLGTSFIAAKSTFLENALGAHLINLTGKTTPAQAFTVLQQASLVLSEDSGLMHMSWVSGIPTLAIFGSTRSDRARPLGPHALLLDSSDLPCGNCMLEECRYRDTHCLSRYTADMVFDKALSLLQIDSKGNCGFR